MTNMENIETPVKATREQKPVWIAKQPQNIIYMRTSTTNRLLTKTLHTLCCVGALTGCSAWATVVPWQLNSSLSAAKEPSQAGYTATARGLGNTPGTDASHQYSFRSAPESAAVSESNSPLTDALKNKAGDVDVQQESRTALSQTAGSTRPDESLLFASNTSVRPATELDEAMAKTFDEEFVSVPTVQFAATAPGSQAASVASMAAMSSGPGAVVVPEMSALFPIVGLIAAVSFTQILRRRRAAQQSGSRTMA
jgi:hypothetical protein